MLATIESYFREWGLFVALLFLRSIIKETIKKVYLRIENRVDEKLPDDLPLGAGNWLKAEIEKRGMTLRVLVEPKGEDHIDAYYPTAKTVILSRRVYEKRDASYWAVAAHELGHAMAYQKTPILGLLFWFARVLSGFCARLAVALTLGNILYARSELSNLALSLFTVSLAADVVVLVDEALASTLAIKMLAGDARVRGKALVGAITALAAAFMTYVGGFVGELITILRFDFVIAKINEQRQFTPAPLLGGFKFIVTAILCIFLIAFAALELRRVARPKKFEALADAYKHLFRGWGGSIVRSALAGTIIFLVWDQPLGDAFVIACVGAIAASNALMIFVQIVGTLLIYLPAWLLAFVARFIGWFIIIFVGSLVSARMRAWVAKEKEKEPTREEPPPSKRTQETYEAMQLELKNNPPILTRVHDLFFASLHIVFAVTFFVAVASAK